MPVFHVSSRTTRAPAPPRKRSRRLSRKWAAILPVWISIHISALLFVVLLISTGSDYTFILLPVFLSFFITVFRRYNLNAFLTSTPLYLLLTACLALIYYSAITALILLTHYDPNTAHIILVTTALAWAVIFDPARAYFQSLIERRFNVRNRETVKAIEAFTSTLREEIDLDQLRDRFLNVIEQTMQPYSVALWLRIIAAEQEQTVSRELVEFTVADDDAMLAYALHHLGTIEVDRVQLDSPLLQRLEERGAELIQPLASQGELIGLLVLGPHLQGGEYTVEEFAMLNTLATQVAPALRVGQLVQERQVQVMEHERIEQELRTAQNIQRAFLPREVPDLPGWQLAPYYLPAREVGGDFYDFLLFEDGRLGLIIGDVTGKGIPAALVMTATRTMLRTAAQEKADPGKVLARVNDLLYPDMETGMFATCFYALLDPASGKLRYANAGHEPPYRRSDGHASELWATGMPLGMMPGTQYEEYETILSPGESLLFYSDGLVEAHNPAREMFGFPRLMAYIGEHPGGPELIAFLLDKLTGFTGSNWEQEDDVTMMALRRLPVPAVLPDPLSDALSRAPA
jgi:serine phosphatase RsbU (regulator of sigma subunit)